MGIDALKRDSVGGLDSRPLIALVRGQCSESWGEQAQGFRR